jgi:ATP-dependent DNA helicase RecG
MQNYFAMGDEVFVYGRLIETKPRTIDHPETEVIEGGEEGFIHINRLTPVYPLTEGLPQRWLRGLIWRALEKFERHITEPGFGVQASAGSRTTRPPEGGTPTLPARANAVHMIHFPEELTDVEIARQRLALDEFVAFQVQIQRRRKNFESRVQALPCGGDNRLMKPFLVKLGFKLTGAQTRVLREIRTDLGGAHPMRRLLQGDVGSGKTAVAACTALMALESGFNVALMAPTEILAEQHFQNFKNWFEPLGIRVELQTGSRKTSNIQHPTSNIQLPDDDAARIAHRASLFIGTHALLASGFDLPNLGLVIIDEQHKFGVAQREQLVRKGRYPHLLVMTATPIPRTLGLTLYGDLDVSVIDELPGGRGRIKTFVRTADKLPKVWAFIREQLAAGRQAYVVYPRVEDSGAKGLKAVTGEFDHLKAALAPFHAGLLHGRLKSREKEGVMAAFRANAVNVLLSTSLIEVGVDVPNATVMLVENAEQFGLAQLHQLRGRIGRGAHESYCILISAAKTREADGRLKVLEETNDGFRIAEADLKLRGPGELLGREQSGMPEFRFGSLADDLELIRRARELAAQITDAAVAAKPPVR